MWLVNCCIGRCRSRWHEMNRTLRAALLFDPNLKDSSEGTVREGKTCIGHQHNMRHFQMHSSVRPHKNQLIEVIVFPFC